MQENKCRYCGSVLDTKLKKDWWSTNLTYFWCSSCKRKNYNPLSRRDKRGIQILLGLFCFIGVVMIFTGQIALPGILTIYLIWTLYKNSLIEKEIAQGVKA